MEMPGTFLPVHELQAGDIVYTRRPKGYQRLAAVAGDTWRHVGLCVTIAGFPWLAEMGPGGFQARPMTTVMKAYDTVALQRLGSCSGGCRTAFVNQVCARMQRPADFHSRVELAGIGLVSLARLGRRSARVAVSLRTRLVGRDGFASRAICSTPLADALAGLCPHHRAVLDVTSHKHDGPQRPQPELAQLAMPDDIWRALQDTTASFWLRKDAVRPAEPHIDLQTDDHWEVTHMRSGT